MAVKKTTAQQTNTTRKTAVKKSTVKKPAAAKTAAKKSTAKKSVKTVTKDKPADYRIGELDQYLFGQGTHYEIYKKMLVSTEPEPVPPYIRSTEPWPNRLTLALPASGRAALSFFSRAAPSASTVAHSSAS